MDGEGTVIGKVGDRSLKGFEAAGKKAAEFLELKKKADAGDKQAKISYELAKMDMDPSAYTLETAKKAIDALGELTKEQRATADGLLTNIEVAEIMKGIGRDKESSVEAGRKFVEMKKAGRVPTGDNTFGTFHSLILLVAEEEKDAKLYEESLNAIKEKFGANINKRWLEPREAKLKELKGEK